jgi:hypothetical protein
MHSWRSSIARADGVVKFIWPNKIPRADRWQGSHSRGCHHLLMDREDPEKRIAELERQFLERPHERVAGLRPSPSRSPGQRTFEATAQRVNWKWLAFLACGFSFAMIFLPVVLMTTHTHLDKHWFHWGFLGLYGVVVVGLTSCPFILSTEGLHPSRRRRHRDHARE